MNENERLTHSLVNVPMPPHFNVVLNDIMHTVVSSIDINLEFWIRIVMSINSRIQVILYQENDPELDDEWLTSNDKLTSFSKYRARIIGRIKGEDSLYVQGPQNSEEYLVVRERSPINTERSLVSEPGTNCNHAPVGK